MNEHRAGRVVRQLEGYEAFEPSPLPPEPPLEFNELVGALSRADQAVGRLAGLARTLPDADLFLAMYVRQEALLSSQIEGTVCTLDDLLEYEVAGGSAPKTLDVGEVVNYVAALHRGIALLDELPLCNRLIREVHATLLRDGRGSDKTPGEFRHSQNWIGPAGCTLADATYVPPPVDTMKVAMADLEKFLNTSDLPTLLVAAIAHAQFETIHPFLDGNGRTGRLLVSLLLHERQVLEQPVLYLSTFLRRYRTRYFELLTAMRDHGDWEAWVSFFLDGVAEAATDAANTAAAIHRLREADRERLSGSKSWNRHDATLLDALYRQPIVTLSWLRDTYDVAASTAAQFLHRAEDAGILHELTGGKRNRVFRYDDYLALFPAWSPVEADQTSS